MNIESRSGKLKVVAFYLPQFYPIVENDRFFEKGFTEWTNVTKAKPLFKGHVQPQLPSELGFYDLRLPEIREQQAKLAKEAGIHGFCYWHYWFGNGKRVLDRVFNEVLKTGTPDFPFCLGWANDSWTGRWHGLDNNVNIEQCYPGVDDYIKHFYEILPALQDSRYITKDGKPIFHVYKASELPNPKKFTDCWRTLAKKEGLKGLYFIAGSRDWDYQANGFDAFVHPGLAREVNVLTMNKYIKKDFAEKLIKSKVVKKVAELNFVKKVMAKGPLRIQYKDYVEFVKSQGLLSGQIPVVLSNWDNTPRTGNNGMVLENSTPDLFREHLEDTLNHLNPSKGDDIVFLKSWNEWAEGNFVEPSREWGTSYLEQCKQVLRNFKRSGQN